MRAALRRIERFFDTAQRKPDGYRYNVRSQSCAAYAGSPSTEPQSSQISINPPERCKVTRFGAKPTNVHNAPWEQ